MSGETVKAVSKIRAQLQDIVKLEIKDFGVESTYGSSKGLLVANPISIEEIDKEAVKEPGTAKELQEKMVDPFEKFLETINPVCKILLY